MTALLKRLFILIILFGVLAVFLFNDHGLIAWYKYSRQEANLEAQIDSLEVEQTEIQYENKRLETDREYIGRKAREDHGMAKKGEKVYPVIPEKEKKSGKK